MIFNVNNIAGKSKIETVPSVAGPLVYNGSEQSPVWLAYDPEQLSISVTLPVSGWTNLTQTVSVPGVTSSNTVIVTPAPSSHAAYGEAGVYCSGQSSESLTFEYSKVPTAALTVNVIILD